MGIFKIWELQIHGIFPHREHLDPDKRGTKEVETQLPKCWMSTKQFNIFPLKK